MFKNSFIQSMKPSIIQITINKIVICHFQNWKILFSPKFLDLRFLKNCTIFCWLMSILLLLFSRNSILWKTWIAKLLLVRPLFCWRLWIIVPICYLRFHFCFSVCMWRIYLQTLVTMCDKWQCHLKSLLCHCVITSMFDS